jgi:hypothetical protein
MQGEHYNAKPMAANAARTCGPHIAGFLCTVAGTLTITDADGVVLVSALPVAAGTWTRIPLFFKSSAGGVVQLAGGAAGTLF